MNPNHPLNFWNNPGDSPSKNSFLAASIPPIASEAAPRAFFTNVLVSSASTSFFSMFSKAFPIWLLNELFLESVFMVVCSGMNFWYFLRVQLFIVFDSF